MKGIVSDIQRCSFHDGAGIRTTVFLKGCNLHCAWCHNPECHRPGPELQFFSEKCIGCGACLTACRQGAHVVEDGRRRFLRELCVACGACARSCYAGALVLVGREMEAREVSAEVLEDRAFYESSGGGITLSGGEPLCQHEFAAEVLALAKSEGIHTAIETNMAWPWEHAADVLCVTDLVMMDIKMMDAARHEEWTGASNEQVLANARRLSEGPQALVVRTPVVPGVNDTPGEIAAIAELIRDFPNLEHYELLPYHPLGTSKYRGLGMEYPLEGLQSPAPDHMRTLAAAARGSGIEVRTAGSSMDAAR